MDIKKLTIIIPFFNEAATLGRIVQRVCETKLVNGVKKEIILVDDASTDNSREVAEKMVENLSGIEYKLLFQPKNQGKGAAIHEGIKNATGDYMIVQDADLEYDPEEYNELLKPVLRGEADVVYGSRFSGGNPHRILFFWHSIGNKFLTGLSNMFTNLNLTDMETCYKLFQTDLLKQIKLKDLLYLKVI